MFREFKRHYHKSKKIIMKLKGSCSFNVNIELNENKLKTVNSIPTGEETVQFIVLMRRFLNKNDKLYYKTIWNIIINEFPNEINESSVQNIENAIKGITKGFITINMNGNNLTAEKIYTIISEGEYFNDDEAVSKYLNELKNIPLIGALFWHQFYSYTFDGFRLISAIFDIVLDIQRSEKYKSYVTPEKIIKKRCIYCLETSASFTSEEHIFPESIGNHEWLLPKGAVCDKCNNGTLSQLDDALLNFEPISFLKVFFVPFTKSGKLPKANFQNMSMKKTHPRNIVITAKDKTGGIQNCRDIGDNQYSFNLNTRGKKFIPKKIGRSLYKIALGMVAFDRGMEEACSSIYDKAREFILKDIDFNNNLLIKTEMKPYPQLSVHHDYMNVGTPFMIDIYGLIFLLNLEEEPKFEINEELTRSKFISLSLKN